MELIDKNFKEWLVVGLVITGVLLPVRLLFVELVSDNWLGSFGLVSIVSIVILVLVKRNKLGVFGKMFERQLIKTHQGKRRIFTYCIMGMTILYFSFTIGTIELANTYYPNLKSIAVKELQTEIDTSSLTDAMEMIKPEAITENVDDYFLAFIYDFKTIAITNAIINDMSQGFLLHFYTVLLVEEIEIVGILIFYRFTIREKVERNETTI